MGEEKHPDREALADVSATVADRGDPSACTVGADSADPEPADRGAEHGGGEPTTFRSGAAAGDATQQGPTDVAGAPDAGATAGSATDAPMPGAGEADFILNTEATSGPPPDLAAVTVDGRRAVGMPAVPGGAPRVATAPRAAPAIPGYEILGELGRGGMGVVYRAREVLLNRPCALKMILAGAHADDLTAHRFLAEAEAVARLQHPNVVQIHRIGEADGLPFFELEYLDGGSLDQKLDGTPWPARRAAGLIEAMARGVAEAHRLGIVHRDLKPANVLLAADGTPKITDFGLAKSLAADSGLTRTDSIMGSPGYMAPEQAEGKNKQVGPLADVYALGAILYELLTGRPPFRGATVLETLEQVKTTEPVPPSRLVPGLPRDVETIALKCLQKEPEKRYDSAAALADDLNRFLAGKPIVARPVPPWERAFKWARRRPTIAALVVAVNVLLASLLGLGVWSYASIKAALATARGEQRKAVIASRQAIRSRDEARDEAYRATISEARALRLGRPPGWRADALSDLARLATLDASGRDMAELRSEAIACLAGFDGREVARFASEDVRRFGAEAPGVWAVAFSPDGKTLATTSGKGGPLLLWDVPGRRALPALAVEADRRALAFLPDGSAVACGVGHDVVFAPTDGGPPRTVVSGAGPAGAIAFDRLGRRMAVAWTRDRTMTVVESFVVYDLASMAPLRTFHGPMGSYTYKVPMDLDPEGARLAFVGSGHAVQVLDVGGDAPPATLGHHAEQVCTLRFSPDGAELATTSNSGDLSVRIWDVAGRRERLRLTGHTARVWGLAYSPEGDLLATSGDDETLRFWDTRTGLALLTLPLPDAGLSAAFSPDGRHVAVGGVNGISLSVLEGRRERLQLSGHTSSVNALVFLPRGDRLATGSADRTVALWDPRSGRRLVSWNAFPSGKHAGVLAISADCTLMATGSTPFAGREDDQYPIILRDAFEGEERGVLKGHTEAVTALAFDRAGRRLASGDQSGAVILWDLATRTALRREKLPGMIRLVAFLDDSRLLVGTDLTVVVVDPDNGKEIRRAQLDGLGQAVHAIAPDAGRLAVGGQDGTVRILGLPGLEVAVPPEAGRVGGVVALAITRDGSLLASAGEDRRILFWDAQTLQRLAALPPLDGPIQALAFDAEGRTLAICGRDEVVTVWDIGLVRRELADHGLDWGSLRSAPLRHPRS